MNKWKKIGLALGVVAFGLGVVLTRVIWDGRGALARGNAALARGDAKEAISEWRRAARWYVPLAPHVTRAYVALEALARRAEAAGDRETALEAWRAIRSSCLATRSFYTPFAARLPVANERIAELMKDLEGPAADPGKSDDERKAWHLDKLTRVDAPSVGWSVVALLGLAAWVGGGFLFAWRGVGADDKLNRTVAARSGALVALGLIVWMWGLYLA